MNNFDTVRELLERLNDDSNYDHGGCFKYWAEYDLPQLIANLAAIEADHYTAADMTSAAAQAFRDGVASVAGQEPVHQFRSPHCSDWYDGVPDHHDGRGPYEVRTLYRAAPVAQQQEPVGTFWQHPTTKEWYQQTDGEPLYRAAPVTNQTGENNGN